MTHLQKRRFLKELRFNGIELTKKYISHGICFECGAHVNKTETGESFIFQFIKNVFYCNSYGEIERIEKPHQCKEIDICCFSPKRKLELMLR